MEFSKNLKRVRLSAGFSQERLANELGVSRQTVSKWENDETYPSTRHIFMLAELLGCSLQDLTGAVQPNSKCTLVASDGTLPAGAGALSRVFGKKASFWRTSIVVVALIVVGGCAVITARCLHGGADGDFSNSLDVAKTLIERADEAKDDFLDVIFGEPYLHADKKIIGYGIAEESNSFYIKCNVSGSEFSSPCSAIIYFCDDMGELSYRCQILDDPDYWPRGQYYQIG